MNHYDTGMLSNGDYDPIWILDQWVKRLTQNCLCSFCRGNFHAKPDASIRSLASSRPLSGIAISSVKWKNEGVNRWLLDAEFRCWNSIEGTTTIVAIDRVIPTPTGFNCIHCNSRNDYAQANTPAGYVCFECR